jgi:hypothetical protein
MTMPPNIVRAYEAIRQAIMKSGSPDGVTHAQLRALVIEHLGVIRDQTIERHIYWLRSLGYIEKVQDWPKKLYVARKRGQREIRDIGESEEKPSKLGEGSHDGAKASEA